MHNNQLRQFVRIIEQALSCSNNDNVGRLQAETSIVQYRDSDPNQFFLDLSLIVASPQFNQTQRQQAGTVASRIINMRINDSQKFYWDEVKPHVKAEIKQNCLSVLINTHHIVMRTAAQIIAVIASIELPRNQWQQIVDTLAENSMNQDVNIKNASITTMGYICEQIRKAGQIINNRFSEQILGAIIMGTRQGKQYIKPALKALEDSMQFIANLLTEANYRDAVFQVFVDNFTNDIEVQDTYNALFEFAKACSPYLGSYSKTLTDLSEVHLARRDQATKFNLHLWEVIGMEYHEKMTNAKQRIHEQQMEQNFLQSVSQLMLPLIMKCLLMMNKEQEEDGEELRISAARALQNFVKVCDFSVVEMVTMSVSNIIQSQQPYHQQASVILFSTICEYPDIAHVRETFSNGFDILFSLLSTPNKTVVRSSLIGFMRLAETVPEVFLTHPNINDIMEKLMEFVRCNVRDVRENAIMILTFITEGLKQNPDPICDNPTILLTKVVSFYSQNMEHFHKDHSIMNEKTIAIIMNIVMNSNKKEIIIQLIEFMMEEYNKIVTSNMEDTAFLLQQILCVLHTSILAHKTGVPNVELMSKLCTLVDYHINKFGIEPEGLSLLGAIATTFDKTFEPRASKYWQTVVTVGLQRVNQMATFKAALACVGDFARMSESGFFTNAADVMQQLMVCIQQNLDRQIKLSIISCIGDLMLTLKDYASNFMDQIIKICDLSFQAVYQLTPNPQDTDYVEELKANLIEMYSCVLFSVNGTRVNRKLFDHFGNLATFVVRTCDKDVHPTVEYLKNSLYLLHDSAAFYWQQTNSQQKIKQIIESNEVAELIRLIRKFEDRSDIRELLDFINSKKMP